jgi:hypothetical protein
MIEMVIIWVAPTVRRIVAANFSVMIVGKRYEG